MRDPVEAMVGAIERARNGISIVWCPDLGLRDWLVGEAESVVATDAAPIRVPDVESALSSPTHLALLVPSNEREAVLDLDGNRERLIETQRTQPIVLFLLRRGDGQRVLAEGPAGLASWVEGSDVDPEAIAQLDLRVERVGFERDLGTTPESWLAAWRTGSLSRTAANYRTAYRAMLLEAP